MALLNDKNLERKISNNNLVEFAREETVGNLPKRERRGSESTVRAGNLAPNYRTVPAGVSYGKSSSSNNRLTVGGHGSSSSGSTNQSNFCKDTGRFTVTPAMSDRERLIKEVNQVKGCIKRQFPELQGDHDVLVIGAHDVGKSSLINSLWLSMTGETEERSPPVGKPYNFAAVPIYRRKATYSAQSGIRLNGGSLQFWDTRGFQKIHKVSTLATLFRFILEGRMPPSYFHQALMLEESKVIKNCRRIDISRANIYKAVVFIERENPTFEMEVQTKKLADALRLGLARSKFHAVKTIPIIRVKNGAEREVKSLAKSDTMTSVSSCESLSDLGMPTRQHNIESYTWSVNYTDYDLDEIDSDEDNRLTVERVPAKDARKYYADHQIRNGLSVNKYDTKTSRLDLRLGADDETEENEIDQDEIDENVIDEEQENEDNEDEENEDNEDEEEAGDSGNETSEGNTQYLLKMNIKPSNRFEFSYRLGPAVEELSPEKHLSLLLFLNNLLTIICHPESNESKKWRFNKDAVSNAYNININEKNSDQKITCTGAFKNLLFSTNRRSRTGN